VALNIKKAFHMREGLGRVAVFYHYFEADPIYRDNLVFFFRPLILRPLTFFWLLPNRSFPNFRTVPVFG